MTSEKETKVLSIASDAISSVGSHEKDAIAKMARAVLSSFFDAGFAIVPEEPTQLMLDAVDHLSASVGSELPAATVWASMISAFPSPLAAANMGQEPLPRQVGKYDDSDPRCLAHAIELSESDHGWCPCRIAAATPEVEREDVRAVTFEVEPSKLFDMLAKGGQASQQAVGARLLSACLAPDFLDAAEKIGLAVYGIALRTPPAPAGELTTIFENAFPDGTRDRSTYGDIEDALDLADAPLMDGTRWLHLPERIAALHTTGFIAGRDAAAQAAYVWWDGEPEEAYELRDHLRAIEAPGEGS